MTNYLECTKNLRKELCSWSGESPEHWINYFKQFPEEDNSKGYIKLLIRYVKDHSYSEGYHEGFTDGKEYEYERTQRKK